MLAILHNQGVISFLDRHWGWLLALALLAAAAAGSSRWLMGLMGAWRARRFPTSMAWDDPATLRRIVFLTLSGLLIVAFAWGYFFRPMMDSGATLLPLAPPHQGFVSYYDELNLVRLGWYLSPLGLGLALLGAILALRQIVLKGQVRPLPLLLLLAAFLLFYGLQVSRLSRQLLGHPPLRRGRDSGDAHPVRPGDAAFVSIGFRPPEAEGAIRAPGRFLLQACGLGVLTAMAATQTVAAWPFFAPGGAGWIMERKWQRWPAEQGKRM